jgi:dihydroneopterin aldolase / 2-amino-4-hydroxy-6-hydroxymethyldihydropteridine diphosphokinase
VSAQPLGPALDDAGHPLDQVVLVGISATGHHGVFEHERREGQTFVADVVVHLDTRRAAATDDLTRTVHYGVLAEHVAEVLAGEPADLVETVAERIAATALVDPLVVAVDVAVHKPGAPITVPFQDVVVRIRRDRQKLPAAAPWTPPARTEQPAPAEVDPDAALPPTAPDDDRGRTAHAAAPVAAPPDRLDEVPPLPVDAVLALGSNLGAAQTTLRVAVGDIAALPGVELVTVSPLARTSPVGGPDQPDFLNAVVLVRTTLSARALLHAAQSVEARHGRERRERWGPRTLDVDLITYDSTLAVTDDLELPHPRAHERAFVLQPWAQVAPDAVLPGLGGGPVAALAATAPDRDGIRWLALDWMNAPIPGATGERADVPADQVEAPADAAADPVPPGRPA